MADEHPECDGACTRGATADAPAEEESAEAAAAVLQAVAEEEGAGSETRAGAD